MATVTISGGTLGAAAAAARLAKLGHDVTLVGRDIGGHWRDDMPPIFCLPATWRDLFRKSGRALDAELARSGLSLVEAPPVLHRFADGTELVLPTERGAQHAAISDAYGEPVAARWRDLLDNLDDVWLALRRCGVERPAPDRLPRDEARALWHGRTLADLAAEMNEVHLSTIITSVGVRCGTSSAAAPALLASRLVVERTFGRWHLVDSHDRPVAGTHVLTVLGDRLATRRVSIARRDGPADLTFGYGTTDPSRFSRHLRSGILRSRVRAAEAPLVLATDHVGTEVVHHTTKGLVVDYPGMRHDYRQPGLDERWGYAPSSWRAWRAIPATVCAGNEPWAELASAALTVYALHERLTGEDVRPANKGYRP